ncbi:MAG: FtsX-like permease family protein [Thermodesulfovibrionales bacterium]|jgi:ABC-type lipoprotein release transport system permease subunit|nr:FtsX-like permease family protein [Thermodesulfovibrionales bacterium]
MSYIDKHRNLIDFTLSSLLRRKGKNIALILVYTLVVFILSSVMFFTHAIKKEASIILKDAPEMVVQRVVAGRHDLIPIRYIEKIKGIRGIGLPNARLWGYYFDPIAGANYTLIVPDDFQYGQGDIAIGKGISRSRLAYEGDIMPFMAYDGALINLRIRNVLSPESELVSSDLILISENDFRRIFGISKEYATDLTVKVRNQREINTIVRKITEIYPDTRVITKNEILRTYDAVFNWRGGIVIVIMSGAVMAFIVFAWDKASGLSAEEKKEIGILKAIGWETSDVILMKFWEGAVVSVTSFIAGIILAYFHVFFASSSLFEPVLKGWSVLYPEFKLTPFIDPYQVSTLFFLTVVPYTVATIIPSWRAATIDPDSVMR